MKFLLAALLLPGLATAAIWPDAIGPYHRAGPSGHTVPVTLTDRAVWDEYGLKDSEAARYQNGGAEFTATAYRLQDPTGALAAFQWQRGSKAAPSKLAALAAEPPGGVLLVHGNYLLSFTGYKPTTPELDALIESLHNIDTTALPTLPGFLPARDLVPNSERYIIGPASLQKFGPGIPPSAAAFHFGAEAQLGVFRAPKGEMALTIFNYPTHQIAMQQVAGFEKLPGAVVKRSGPLVAVILSPADPDAAERLLSQVRYQADVTRDERIPTRLDNIAWDILNIFLLIGILLVFSTLSGLAVGGFYALRRCLRKGEEPEPMITLHLEQR